MIATRLQFTKAGLEATRRAFLTNTGQATLSATAVALLAGTAVGRGAYAAADAESVANDVAILNTAIAAEHEAVAAYQVGAESGLLEAQVLDLAVQFQGHHREHADALAKAVRGLGGAPGEAAPSYAFPVDTLNTQTDVLRFAAGLEQGAVSAYLGAVPLFANRDLAHAAASILGDEAMHWAVLRYVLGETPVPGAFVT